VIKNTFTHPILTYNQTQLGKEVARRDLEQRRRDEVNILRSQGGGNTFDLEETNKKIAML
jgi:hypothetical protein